MSRFHSYLNTSISIIEKYTGATPFSGYLKLFFSSNKKYGSKDRKYIASLCYYYFRLGFAAKQYPVEQQIIIGIFLCSDESSELLKILKPEWNESIPETREVKWAIMVNRTG